MERVFFPFFLYCLVAHSSASTCSLLKRSLQNRFQAVVECLFVNGLYIIFNSKRIMHFCEYSEDNPAPHGRSSSFRTTYSSTEDTEVRAVGASSVCSACLSVCLFVCLSVCLSVRLSVCLSVCLSINQSVRSPIS